MKRKTQMKKLMTICAIVTTLAIMIPLANAGMVAVNSWQTEVRYDSLPGSVNAGKINITLSGFGAPYDGTINTFCVETREHINQSSYNGQINTVAIKGGEAVSDPLNAETAWLFWQYITGAVTLTTTTEMADFQMAIWKWETEVADALNPAALAYYNSAIGKSLGGPDGIGSVRIVNLGSSDDNFMYQDLLVPEPATMCLLGLGSVMILISRKRKA
jgi:hypothetical protein